MSDDRAEGPHIRKVHEGTHVHVLTDWIVVTLVLGAAAASAFFFWRPLVFDPDSPDFSPAVFVPVVLCVFALKYLFSAIRATMLGRRFGQSVMEMEGETVAPGEKLEGVIRVPVDLEPLGDYEIRLRCVEQTESPSSRLQDYIRAEQTLRVKAEGVNPRAGIPFTFLIPSDARSTADADMRTGETVRWILEIKAPLKGLNYYAIFGVVVRARPRAAQPEG